MPSPTQDKSRFTHLVVRTSPTGPGQRFIGRCRYCGAENLPPAAALWYCSAAERECISQEHSLLNVIQSPDGNSTN
jgi:hypothetical protein